MKCENCQKELILTKTQKYQYTESGLDNVFLDNIEVYDCINCDLQIPVIPKIIKLHNTIGFAIICKNSLLGGAEIQFLRKNLGIKSQDWAKLLRTKKETLSRWESDTQSISPQSDLLIRYLYLRLLEEKKEIRFEQTISEKLSEVENKQIATIINVEQIENYSYLSFDEAIHLARIQNSKGTTFDFDLDESNIFLSEIETPLPFGAINIYSVKNSAVANQELALAA